MSGFEALLFGAAGAGGAAATTGMIGAGGAFSAGTALSSLGTAMSAAGALSQGKAAQSSANYNAQYALIESQSRETAQRAQAARQLGTMRAAIGKSGATSEGTPLLVLAESAANAEIDALNTRYTGQRQANLYRAQGANARSQGYLTAGTSLLTAASKII
jgi:hypothetical protein